MKDKNPNRPSPLQTMTSRELGIEQWLRKEVVPAYQQLKVDPASGMSVAEVRAALAQRRQKSS